MVLRRIAALAAAHLGVAFLSALVAFGSDMDRLRSRSAWSRAAGVVHDVLWFPHDAALRALPNAWLVRAPVLIPAAIVANSLVWGAALYALWRVARAFRRRSPGTPDRGAQPGA